MASWPPKYYLGDWPPDYFLTQKRKKSGKPEEGVKLTPLSQLADYINQQISGFSGSGFGTSGYSGYSGWSGYSGLGVSGYSGYSGTNGTGEIDVNQTTHGFSTGDVIRHNGSIYVKAQSDTAEHAEAVGIVIDIIGPNDFTLLTNGYADSIGTFTAGSVYFLSPSSAGMLTATEPSTAGQISKPLFIATSTTSGYFFNFRGVAVTAAKEIKTGRENIGNGTDTVSVIFASPFLDTNYSVVSNITNITDGAASSMYSFTTTAVSNAGFTVTLIGNTDSANYFLEWIAIHD